MTGSDWKWGVHVFWDGEPLTCHEKGIAGSGKRKSRGLGWETADQSGKWIGGSGWGKTAEEGGRTVQSPIGAAGVGIKREPQG